MTEPIKYVYYNHVVWSLDDELHREDGPALEWANGYKEWYLFNEEVSKEKFKQVTYSD